MCVSRCLRCVGVSLVPMAIVCILCNILLLVPELKIQFLLDDIFYQSGNHVCIFLTRVSCSRCCQSYRVSLLQMLCQLLYSCLCLLSAASCSLVSATGLSQGPLCLYNDSSGPTWGVPHSGYLFNRTLWSGVCLEPSSVVQWNLVLFSVMGTVSGLQTVLCGQLNAAAVSEPRLQQRVPHSL
uniref:Uncharacterized protein n=1 Tax=Neolamprologus brichardi TaxID=32507 RepID=A0A3Q4MHU7_NEOBR